MTEFMTNGQGHQVPVDRIKPEDMLENGVVLDLMKKAAALHTELEQFKAAAFEEVRAFQALLSEKYGVTRGGEKGGLTITSFDGRQKIVIANQEFIDFGPQLQAAKALIDECIMGWGEDSNINIRVLVMDAFRVEKNQRVNTQRILGLRRHDIQDERWLRAMTAINDSIRVSSSKLYVRFYTRPSAESEWDAVTLDIAKV